MNEDDKDYDDHKWIYKNIKKYTTTKYISQNIVIE